MFSREDFMMTLIKQYSAAIDEIVIDCESLYRSQLDIHTLDTKIQNVLQAARLDGLDEGVIWSLIERKVPAYYDYAMGIDHKIAA